MKITINTKTYLPNIGGIENYVEMLRKEFEKKNINTKIIADTKSSQNQKNIYRNINFLEKIKLFKKSNLIVMINYTLRDFLFFIIFKKKIIINHQINYETDNFIGKVLSYIKINLSRYFINAPCSKYVSKIIKKNCFVIPNCYDDKLFYKSKKNKKNEFIFCGRLVKDKGAHVLIDCFIKLLRHNDKLTLGIIGDGPEKLNLLKKIKNKELKKNIKFYGFVRGKKLKKIIENYKFMVIPSLWNEPFGIVALEGIALNNTVIAFKNGGLNEAIKDCGIVVNPNKTSLYNAMKKVIKSERKYTNKKFISKCQAHLKNYTPNMIVDKYLKLYERLIK